MLPVFRPGETVLVSPARPRAGDCAVYDYRGRTLLHRVLRALPQGALLADDAARLEPHLVPWSAVRGTVLASGPLGGGLTGRLYSGLRRALSRLRPRE